MAVKLVHKNSGVKNKPVRETQIDYGEISINWHESGPFVQVKDSQNEIIRVGGVIIQVNQPVLAQKGAFWFSNNPLTNEGCTLYIYNGQAWIPVCGDGAGGSTEFIACTDGGIIFDEDEECWKIDESWLLEWALNNRPDMVDPGNGKLTIKDSDGNILGEFTANQGDDTEVIIPPGFSGDYNDLINKPEINDGRLRIIDAEDNVLGAFTANQALDTDIKLPPGGSDSCCDWEDIPNKPCIPECTTCEECLEALCRYMGTPNLDWLLDWLGPELGGYGYEGSCARYWYNGQGPTEPQPIYDIYMQEGKNPFCIYDFDHCFTDGENYWGEIIAEHHLHYRLEDGTEGTFQTKITRMIFQEDGRHRIRFIPDDASWDELPKDKEFEVYIDIEEEPDNLVCNHPDHNNWVYWDNVVGVPPELLELEAQIENLPRIFNLDDDDLLMISRVSYEKGEDGWGYYPHEFAIKALHAKQYFHEIPPPLGDGHPNWHVKNGPEEVIHLTGNPYHAYDVDGNYIGMITQVEKNQEVIFVSDVDCEELFSDYYTHSKDTNRNAVFELGDQTDTKNVRNMQDLFYYCKSFTGAGVEFIDTRNVISGYGIFRYCDVFEGDCGAWNVSNMLDMGRMFYGCKLFNADISPWNVRNCTSFSYMFSSCAVFDQPLAVWNTMNALNMSSMFNGCTAFFASDNSDLSEWCVPHVSYQSGSSWASLTAAPVWGSCPRGEWMPGFDDFGQG